jgi:hypothetical protein
MSSVVFIGTLLAGVGPHVAGLLALMDGHPIFPFATAFARSHGQFWSFDDGDAAQRDAGVAIRPLWSKPRRSRQ